MGIVTRQPVSSSAYSSALVLPSSILLASTGDSNNSAVPKQLLSRQSSPGTYGDYAIRQSSLQPTNDMPASKIQNVSTNSYNFLESNYRITVSRTSTCVTSTHVETISIESVATLPAMNTVWVARIHLNPLHSVATSTERPINLVAMDSRHSQCFHAYNRGETVFQGSLKCSLLPSVIASLS